MLKFITHYTLNDNTYPSEIYTPHWLDPHLIARQLPNEIITSSYTQLTDDDYITSSDYIRKHLYIDAVHRLMYMLTISNTQHSLIKYIQDDGILHQLTHLKSNFGHPSIDNSSIDTLCQQADEIEQSTPGSYLWAKHLTQTNIP